jgi:histidyl-tRNA synthetase
MSVSIPKGTRDFIPIEAIKRKYLFSLIESVFQKYAYVPIETPTLENLSTLTGKYGEEGDKLLFKVLNNGDFLKKADKEAIQNQDSQKLASSIASRGLRYDLTVPFARFVVMHQNEIQLPFKRYQIQPVWRADRPQKGRYREFYQCDVDVVGSTSLAYEAEFVQILDEVFEALQIRVQIRMNNRKVLAGIAEVAGVADRFTDMTISIDKLDKIGWEGVHIELERREIDTPAREIIEKIFSNPELETLEQWLKESEVGMEGIRELKTVQEYLGQQSLANQFIFDATLARGLSYYTGCIFEVNALDFEMGSISGGGRYDDLTGVFGLKGVSGVGISFGAERIYDIMEGLHLFPENLNAGPTVLCLAMDEQSHLYGFGCVREMRKAGIQADLYPDPVKLKKQMKYAHQVGAEYVVIIGETEMQSGQLTFKKMATGEQSTSDLPSFISKLTG